MADDEIWQAYKRKLAVVAGKKKAVTRKKTPDKAAARKAAESAPLKIEKTASSAALAKEVHHKLERTREKALRDGLIEIEARIDLHGLTQVEAFERLAVFIQRAVAGGKRHVLIITGKGRDGVGVLRLNLPHWLGQLPEAKTVLALRPAAPQHGGDGAFYVVLRKR